LEIVCHLAGGNEVVRCYKHSINVCAAVPSEKRIAGYSSQHDDAIRCSLSPCCKFELNLRFFAIWLVMINFYVDQNMKFSRWSTVPPEQRVASSSSQHGGEDRCTVCYLAGDDKNKFFF